MMSRLFTLFFSLSFSVHILAGEGLWHLLLLDSLNYKDMREKGFQLSADDIYSINEASLKDAVVIFGGGCTGELISPEGLVITNHHCGYSRIQALSTVDKNYLADGFWAGSKAEELPSPGLTVTFLVRIEDVTEALLQGIPDSLPEQERSLKIAARIPRRQQEAVDGTHYHAEIKSFFFGKAYYLFVYEVFQDVRLVGTPPESIGRFGGDTDNWIWPRHTGDFSLFRIYAGQDNNPAAYSSDNVPYKPKKYLPINTGGVQEGDFTMVLGYPGRTDEYLTADALDVITRQALPAKIEMRTRRLEALADEMEKGPRERLRFSGRYVGVSNAWKKWIGVTQGVRRSGAIERKKDQETAFDNWANSLAHDPEGYSSLMDAFKRLNAEYKPLYLSNDLGNELLNSIDLFGWVGKMQSAFYEMQDSSEQYQRIALQKMKSAGRNYFRSGALAIDQAILPPLLKIYADHTDAQFHPDFYRTILTGHKGDYEDFTSSVFGQSMFTDSIRYYKSLMKSNDNIRKMMSQDPLVIVYRDFNRKLAQEVYQKADSMNRELNRLYRRYLTGMQEMEPARRLYPDANFTMRLAYGKVEGYQPADAIRYSFFSTLDGILEKENPEVEDYQVPEKLKDLVKSEDLAPYDVDGKVPVCFIASNHTSGGNSGSPVLNARGELIGINFDRNWEGTVSDYAYDPAICRNISLDIRYVLFIIDKVADADWMLDELTLIKN